MSNHGQKYSLFVCTEYCSTAVFQDFFVFREIVRDDRKTTTKSPEGTHGKKVPHEKTLKSPKDEHKTTTKPPRDEKCRVKNAKVPKRRSQNHYETTT